MAAKRGRPFEKGHPGGPGRPKGTPKEREYLDTFRRCVTLDKWAVATEKLLELAMAGNIKAFEALAKYCLPQPAMMLDWSEEARKVFRFAGMDDKELAEKMAHEVVEAFKVHHGDAA
jgi:hypothetical protein